MLNNEPTRHERQQAAKCLTSEVIRLLATSMTKDEVREVNSAKEKLNIAQHEYRTTLSRVMRDNTAGVLR